MLLNSFIAWNLAAKEGRRSRKKILAKHDFYAAYSEELLAYTEEEANNGYCEELGLPVTEADVIPTDSEIPSLASHSPNHDLKVIKECRPHCAVCKMEHNIAKRSVGGKCHSRCKRALAFCEVCGIYAHTTVDTNSRLQKIPELAGKSCFEILHSNCCKGLWDLTARRRTVSTKHNIYNQLLGLYHIAPKKGSRLRKRKV